MAAEGAIEELARTQTIINLNKKSHNDANDANNENGIPATVSRSTLS